MVLSTLTLSVNNELGKYLPRIDGLYPAIEATTEPHSTVPPNHNETTTTENASSNLSLPKVTPPPTATTLPIAVPAGTNRTGNATKTPLPPYPWHWIHTPKTGTSFANVLFALSCPEEIVSLNVSDERKVDSKSVSGRYGIQSASIECKSHWTDGKRTEMKEHRPQWWLGEHASLKPGLPLNQVFITIREPLRRLVSDINHKQETFQKRFVTNDMKATAHGYYKEATSRRYTVRLDAKMTHCMTAENKSTPLLNNGSDHVWTFDQNISKLACDVVQQAAWVGITDRFDESICLLHAMYDFPHHPRELLNMRPGMQLSENLNLTEFGKYYRSFTDVPDDGVWKCGLERFERDLRTRAPHCIVSR